MEFYKVENARYHKNMILLKLKGINTPEEAEMLRNAFLEIDREDAIPLEEGTYFIADGIRNGSGGYFHDKRSNRKNREQGRSDL